MQDSISEDQETKHAGKAQTIQWSHRSADVSRRELYSNKNQYVQKHRRKRIETFSKDVEPTKRGRKEILEQTHMMSESSNEWINMSNTAENRIINW